METVTWHELRRLVRLALMGVGAAFAAVVLSLLLGSSAAQAADDEDSGVLGAVTGLVGDTMSVVGSTVTEVTSTATDVVSSVVDVAPAPVQPVVETVTTTVSDAVATTVAPVQHVVSADVVTTVSTPVVEIVSTVPVVSAVGVDAALSTIAADLDSTLAVLVGAVASRGESLAPSAPALETRTSPRPHHDLVAALPIVTTDAALPAPRSGPTTSVPAFAAVPAASVVVTALTTAGIAATDAHALLSSMGALCLSAISSGPGGAGLGVWALAALLPFVAHRAWVRRAGPEDQLVPASPAGSTDVSPD